MSPTSYQTAPPRGPQRYRRHLTATTCPVRASIRSVTTPIWFQACGNLATNPGQKRRRGRVAHPAPIQKIGLIVVGLVLALVTAACSDDTNATDQSPSTTTPSTTTSSTSTTTTQKQAPQTTAPTSTTTTLAEPALIGWEDLENLSFELDGDTIGLEDGQATISYGGASETMIPAAEPGHSRRPRQRRRRRPGHTHHRTVRRNRRLPPDRSRDQQRGNSRVPNASARRRSHHHRRDRSPTRSDRSDAAGPPRRRTVHRHHPTHNPRNRPDRSGTSSPSDQHQTAQEPPVARTGTARHSHPFRGRGDIGHRNRDDRAEPAADLHLAGQRATGDQRRTDGTARSLVDRRLRLFRARLPGRPNPDNRHGPTRQRTLEAGHRLHPRGSRRLRDDRHGAAARSFHRSQPGGPAANDPHKTDRGSWRCCLSHHRRRSAPRLHAADARHPRSPQRPQQPSS